MADTFVKIATVTVGAGGASSINFNSIPSTYTDLQVLLSTRSSYPSGGTPSIYMLINGSTSGQAEKVVYGNGSSAASSGGTNGYVWTSSNSYTANTFGNASFYIPNYASSNYKSYSADGVSENNATSVATALTAGVRQTSSSITTLSFTTDGNWMQYSTATLYGITKA